MNRALLAALGAALLLCCGRVSSVVAQAAPETPAPAAAPAAPTPAPAGTAPAAPPQAGQPQPAEEPQAQPEAGAPAQPTPTDGAAQPTPAADATSATGTAAPTAAPDGTPAGATVQTEDAAAAPATDGPIIEMPADEPLSGEQPAATDEADDPEHETGVTLGGYGQHELIAAEGQDTRFRNHRYVLFIFGRIHERITTATELEFEFAGSPLKKDGTLGPGEVLLEYSVVDLELTEWLSLRAGVILIPVSSFNIHHDAPTRELVDRPIAYTTVVPSTWFESGAGAFGEVSLGGDHALTYELYVVNGLDARIGDGFGLRAARGSHFEDNNSDKALVGRVAYLPTPDYELGLSGYTGDYDKRDNRVNMLNFDYRLRFGRLTLLGEAVYVSIDPGYVEGFSAASDANSRVAVPTGMWGFFAQAHYRIPVPGALGFDEAAITPVIRYEGKDTDDSHDTALGDQRRLTLGVNFRPIPQVAIKSDFQWNARGVDLVRSAPDLWKGEFWDDRDAGFLFDSYIASVAYLF